MNTAILGLLAETSIHPGSGSDTGFVDLPVAREAATDYPVIVGSSLKGALRDLVGKNSNGIDCKKIFGEQDNAGQLIVSDARLLLLPVRSMTSHYKWVTCPFLLERFERDHARAGNIGRDLNATRPNRGSYLGDGTNGLFLEERQFTKEGELPESVVDVIGQLIRHESTRARLEQQLVILHEDDFAWFARYGLAVNARNVLHNENKTSENLWYEETIPPDSLFYCLLAERGGDAVSEVCGLFNGTPYLQVGGNATIGQGWFAVQIVEGGAQ